MMSSISRRRPARAPAGHVTQVYNWISLSRDQRQDCVAALNGLMLRRIEAVR